MKRFFSIILAIILACTGTFDTVLASEAAASDELPEGTKSVTVSYDREAAVAYARKFALTTNNGIFKSMGLDCTNFVSQCMWSGYGGTKGYTLDDTAALKARVAADYRQTSTWYGRECRLAVSVRKRRVYPGGRFLGLCNNKHRVRSACNGIQ